MVAGSITAPASSFLCLLVPSPGMGRGNPWVGHCYWCISMPDMALGFQGDKSSSSHRATSCKGWWKALTPPPCVPAGRRESRDRDCEAGGKHRRIRLQAARGREIGREQQCSKKGF